MKFEFPPSDAIGSAGVGHIVGSRTELADVSAGNSPVYLSETRREGWFRWDAGDLSADVALDSFQGIHVAPAGDTTGASGAWVRVRDKTFVSIDWFGAGEWSEGDFTENIQAALDFAGEEGGECYVPTRIYKQSATLHMKRSCWLHGSGNWAWGYRPLAATTGVYGSRLMWTSAAVTGADETMQILVESDPQGQRLMQPRVSDLIVDGNARAGYGVYISASEQPVVRDVWAEQHIVASVAFLPRGGSCIGPIWDNIFTNARTAAACQAASGLVMDATSDIGFNTGGHGGYLRAASLPTSTGWGMKIGNQDAFLMDKMEIFGFGGEGHSHGLWFMYDPLKGGGGSKKHYITYFAGGMIKVDAGCSGIDIGAASETTILNLDPDAQVVFRCVDQVTGDSYRTLQYNFTDEYELLPAAATLTGATLGVLGISQALVLADGATDGANWTHVAPPEWNHGRIVGLRVVYGSSVADPGTVYRLHVTLRCPRTDGTTVASGSVGVMDFIRTETFSVPGPALADTFYTAELEMALPVPFKKRCAVIVNVQRIADGSETIVPDTGTQALKIVAVREMYKSDGPNANVGEAVSATMGYWESGKWSREAGYSEYVGGPFEPLPSAFEAEATTLIDLLDPPPYTLQQILINKTIKDLKDAGLWTAFDLLYFLGQQEEPWSILNWIDPGTDTLTEITGSPRWTRLQGYRSQNAGWLSAGVNWNALTNYTQNNCHVGAFVFTEAQGTGPVLGSASGNVAITPRDLSGNMITRCNSTASNTLANASSRGHFLLNRTASTGYQRWVRGALIDTPTATSAAVVAEPVVICRAIQLNATHDVATFHCGRALTSLEIVNLGRILAYHVGHMTG